MFKVAINIENVDVINHITELIGECQDLYDKCVIGHKRIEAAKVERVDLVGHISDVMDLIATQQAILFILSQLGGEADGAGTTPHFSKTIKKLQEMQSKMMAHLGQINGLRYLKLWSEQN